MTAVVPLTAACFIAIGDRDDSRTQPARTDAWTQRAIMRVGERALFDGGALEITLQTASVSHAMLLVRDARGQNTVELRGTGASSGFMWPPYHVWMESTAAGGVATIVVSRAR